MHGIKTYKLNENEYNYLLPALKNKLFNKREDNKHYFYGNNEDLYDMLNRLKGHYNYYGEITKILSYKCFMQNSLKPFRIKIKNNNTSF